MEAQDRGQSEAHQALAPQISTSLPCSHRYVIHLPYTGRETPDSRCLALSKQNHTVWQLVMTREVCNGCFCPTSLCSPHQIGVGGCHFRRRGPHGQSGNELHWTQGLPQAGPCAPILFSDLQIGHKLDIIVSIKHSELTKHYLSAFFPSPIPEDFRFSHSLLCEVRVCGACLERK